MLTGNSEIESQLINIHEWTELLPIAAFCWFLIRFIATIVRVRVRVRVRVSDIRVNNFRVNTT